MNRLLTNTEFFTYDNKVMVRTADGSVRTLEPTDYDLIDSLCDYLDNFYTKAYNALCDEYKQSALNQPYFRYRIVCRFVRCNFGGLDDIPDIVPSTPTALPTVSQGRSLPRHRRSPVQDRRSPTPLP